MSLFYRIAHRVGFTPWEEGLAQGSVRRQIEAMFDWEEAEGVPPASRPITRPGPPTPPPGTPASPR